MAQTFLETHGNELNERQLEAVKQTEGPVLVLAGAGSGKTRVLTYRIAHLIYDHKVPLDNILAMTFSNKAAREMHDRVKSLIGDESGIRLPWISTFHSVSARLLRMYGKRVGFEQDYVIYDKAEQLGMIKLCFDRLNVSKNISAEAVLAQIGTWKNQAKTPAQAKDLCASSFDRTCHTIYERYRAEMHKAQAMDFDDLLLYTYQLFHEDEELKAHFQKQWRYVLIDEFQDTNEIQNKLLTEVINSDRNVCVVGDDDQSIYGWRGAKIENILNFDKKFQGCKIVKLEQNYRSTANILKAAASIISRNEKRHEKTLWTKDGPGARILMAQLSDDRSEARFVIKEIKRLMSEENISADEFAVLYRLNSLSRCFEEECLRQRLPYRIVGGFRFYERREIKDILAYLKILINRADIMSFRRTVNTPLRGVGKATIEKLESFANFENKPIGQWLKDVDPLPVKGKARAGLESYQEFLRWGYEAINVEESLVDIVSETVRRSKYVEVLQNNPGEENLDRLENIRELMSALQEFEETWEPQNEIAASEPKGKQKLRDFLERVTLMSDVDRMLDGQGQVTFMSMHAAKGLEFKICFMAGMEEALQEILNLSDLKKNKVVKTLRRTLEKARLDG